MARSARNRLRSNTSPLHDLLRRLDDRLNRAPSFTVAALFLCFVMAVVFGVSLGYPRVFEDYVTLASDRLATYGQSLPAPGATWLAQASFGWTGRIPGSELHWHRVVNLAVHALSVLFTFALVRRLLGGVERPGGVHGDWVAFLAAALYAVHPVSVYATAYLSARPILFAGFFALVAIWSVLKALDATSSRVAWLAPFACACAVSSSPAAVGVPLVLALAAKTGRNSRSTRVVWFSVLASAIVVVGWAAAALATAGTTSGAGYLQAAGEGAVRWLRGAGYALVPMTRWMGIDMPEPVPSASFGLGVLALGVLSALVACGIFFAKQPRRRDGVFLVGCLAALGLMQALYPGAWANFTIWQIYVGVPFVTAVVAWAVARLPARVRLLAGALGFAFVGALGLSALTPFSSHVALWDDAIRAAERRGPQAEDARLYVNRGTVHRADGHPIAAIADYTRALELQPTLARALRGRAQAYIEDTRYGDALEDLRRLLEIEPDQPVTHADIGLVLMQTGKLAEALKSFNMAVAQGVREPRVFLNRGLALFQAGGLGAAPRALDDIERALALNQGYALAHFNRGLIFEQAARAGMRLRDAASPQIMRLVAAQNIERACRLGHRPACDLARLRAEQKAGAQDTPGSASTVVTPEALRDGGLPGSR